MMLHISAVTVALIVGFTLMLPAPAKANLDIVVMGESYAAGWGARDANDDPNYEGLFGCMRSPTSWGGLYAASVGANTCTNVACAGGVTEDVWNDRENISSWPVFPWTSCPAPASPDEYWTKPFPFTKCWRNLYAQVDAITADTDLVMVSMGGNDVEFMKIMNYCFVPAFGMQQANCESAITNTKSKLDQVEADLKTMLIEIKKKLPAGAKVVLVYYPLMVMDVGFNIGTTAPEDTDEQVRAVVEAVNERIYNAATDENVEVYSSTPDDFGGREIDPRPGIQYVNFDRWINEPADGFDRFHPKPEGHAGLAAAIQAEKGTFGL